MYNWIVPREKLWYNGSMKSTTHKKEWRRVLFALLRPWVRLVARLWFGASTEVYKGRGPYLVLANHSYIADAMLVGAAFREPLHIVAAAATLHSGAGGRLVAALADPIPVDKAGMDIKGLRRMLAEAKAGHSIGLFPEGNITIDGSPLPIDRSVAKLAKQLRLNVVLYRVEGGYFKHPKWAKTVRKGRVRGRVVDVISAEEAADATVEQLYARIMAGISYDAFDAPWPDAWRGKRLAEGIERLLYYCPRCRVGAGFTAEGDAFVCRHCGAQYHIDALCRTDGPYVDTAAWNAWQQEMALSEADTAGWATDGVLFEVDTHAEVARGALRIDDVGVHVGTFAMAYDTLNGAVLHDCNHLLLTCGGCQYRFVPDDWHANVLPTLYVIKARIEG